MDLGYDIIELIPGFTELSLLWIHPQMKTTMEFKVSWEVGLAKENASWVTHEELAWPWLKWAWGESLGKSAFGTASCSIAWSSSSSDNASYVVCYAASWGSWWAGCAMDL